MCFRLLFPARSATDTDKLISRLATGVNPGSTIVAMLWSPFQVANDARLFPAG